MGKRYRIFLKILAGFVAGLAMLAIMLIAFTIIFQDEIKSAALKQLNSHLQTKLIIKPKNLSISVFEHFPNVSIRLKNFKVLESGKGRRGTLAAVKNLSLVFNPLDIIQKKFILRKIFISDAYINLKVNNAGLPNYLVWKSTANEGHGNENDKVNLNSISLKRIRILYNNEKDSISTEVKLNAIKLFGSFSESIFTMTTTGELYVKSLKTGTMEYPADKTIEVDTRINVNSMKEIYSIDKARINIGKARFNITGTYENLPSGGQINSKIQAEEADIQTFVGLLPDNVSNRFKEYYSSGKIYFSADVRGNYSANYFPEINCSFGLNDAEINSGKNSSLEHVFLQGTYSNGNQANLTSSFIELKGIRLVLSGKKISGNLAIHDFRRRVFNTSFNGEIDLKDLKKFAGLDEIDTLDGILVANGSFSGETATMESLKKTGVLKGSFQIKNVNIVPKNGGIKYTNLNALLVSNGKDLDISEFSVKVNHSDFTLKGSFKNLAPFLFLPDQNLFADATIQSHLIDLEDFFTTTSAGSKDTVYKFTFPPFLISNFSLDADKIRYAKFSAEEVSGKVAVSDRSAILSGVRFKTMNGSVELSGIVKAEGEKVRTQFNSTLKNIDVSSLFYQLGNFGQDYITDKNLKGRLSAIIAYESLWNSDLSVDLASINSTDDITIDNGQVVKWQPFIDLGNFLKVKSLDHLYFNRLTDKITIRNKTIYVPQLDINSSALNMSVAGTHTFDNVMNYKMKVNVSQLLFGKKKEYEDEFGEVKVDESGGVNIFLSMFGPGDNPQFKFDGVGTRKNIEKGLQSEKDEIKKILQPEEKKKENQDLNTPNRDYELQFDDDDNTSTGKKTTPDKPIKNDTRKKEFRDFMKKIGPK